MIERLNNLNFEAGVHLGDCLVLNNNSAWDMAVEISLRVNSLRLILGYPDPMNPYE